MAKIVIFGAGGHAKVVIDLIEAGGQFEVAGLIDRAGHSASVLGYPVLGCEEDLPRIVAGIDAAVVAIGDNWLRWKVVQKIKTLAPALRFVPLLHPAATIARGAQIGEGTVVMAGAVINRDTRIGRHCIINTNASIDHDNSIADFASIAPGATTGGKVKVGEYTAIGLGASIIHNITIGEHTVVGAGATVVNDIPPLVVSYGTPAKVMRTRHAAHKDL